MRFQTWLEELTPLQGQQEGEADAAGQKTTKPETDNRIQTCEFALKLFDHRGRGAFAFGLRVDLTAASFSSKSFWTAAINRSRLVAASIEAIAKLRFQTADRLDIALYNYIT
ncbi:hypothetical protein U8P75_19630 [Rhizobium beringeri]|nr:hypothetical protein U8P75_19630 [Rhizobium beringeri]